MSDFELADVLKDPAETRTLSVDFFNLCAKFWEPNKPYAISATVRPAAGNGLEYVAGGAGTSSSKEPRWPTTAGQTVVDGSITWTAQAASTASLNVPSSPSVSVSPSGLTAGSVTIADTTRVTAALSNGTEGQAYLLTVSATINGKVRARNITVQVQKR